MKTVKKKLRVSRGETLVETLTAIVVIALASVALAAMIGAASRMDLAARANDERLYSAISQLETADGGGESGTVTVTVGGQEGRSVAFSVTFSDGGDGLLRAYDMGGGS